MECSKSIKPPGLRASVAASRPRVVIRSLQRRTRRRRKNCGLNCNDVGSIPVLGFFGKLRTPHVPPNDIAGILALRIRNENEGRWLDAVLYGPDAVGLNPK